MSLLRFEADRPMASFQPAAECLSPARAVGNELTALHWAGAGRRSQFIEKCMVA